MKAILIIEKGGKKFGYGLTMKGTNQEKFKEILCKVTEGYQVILMKVK